MKYANIIIYLLRFPTMSNPAVTCIAAIHAETTRTLLRTRSCSKLFIGDKVEMPVTFKMIPAVWGKFGGWEESENLHGASATRGHLDSVPRECIRDCLHHLSAGRRE